MRVTLAPVSTGESKGTVVVGELVTTTIVAPEEVGRTAALAVPDVAATLAVDPAAAGEQVPLM